MNFIGVDTADDLTIHALPEEDITAGPRANLQVDWPENCQDHVG